MENHLTEIITDLVFQLAIILSAAKVMGEICERYIKIPPVLGELSAGIIIGPFALGGIDIPLVGSLFGQSHGALLEESISLVPVSTELWAVAQIAAVILLFSAGLETNLRQFMKYAGPASLIAIGGVLVPFACGVYGTIWFGFADSFSDPKALFMGAILTATSVGITARVLSDIKHLDSAEGVTILAAAVLDDVLGILVLTVVVGTAESGGVSLSDVALVGGKAVGFWIALTGIGILLSKYISIFLDSFRVPGAAIALALSLAFLAAGLAESFGLAMIIGAYSMGLSLSGTKIAHRLEEPMRAVYNALVPIFFVVMGMLVDIPAMKGVLVFGAVITGLAVMSKIIGSGVPALMTGFTKWGSWRVGIGMLPRGEVALIIAGIGLSRGIVGADLFGVSIMMTVVTTLIAPIILVPAFKNNIEGRRSSTKE